MSETVNTLNSVSSGTGPSTGASAAIGTANTVVGGLVNAALMNKQRNWQLSDRDAQWNREDKLLAEQRQYAEKQRDYENWYNSPVMQKMRNIQAGLSPVQAIDGQTAGSEVDAPTSKPDVDQPSSPALSAFAGNLTSNFRDSAALFAQLKLLKAQEDNLVAEAENKREDTYGKKLSNWLADMTKESKLAEQIWKEQGAEQTVQNLKATYDNLVWDKRNKIVSNSIQNLQRNYMARVLPFQQRIVEAKCAMDEAKARKIDEIIDTELALNRSKMSEAYAFGENARANARTLDAVREDYTRLMAGNADTVEEKLGITRETKDAVIRKLKAEAGLSEKEANAFWVNTIIRNLDTIVKDGLSIYGAISGVPAIPNSASNDKSLRQSPEGQGWTPVLDPFDTMDFEDMMP